MERHEKGRTEYRQAFDSLKAAGDANLNYLVGSHLLGHDDEATVDSSHPTDLGFMRMADILEPLLRQLIG
jgi:hypothetical protein